MHRPARQHVQSVVSVASCGRVLVGRATATQLSRSASSNGSVGLTFGLLCALETRAPVPFRFSQRGCSATVSMCQPGDVALSAPRLADLVVNRDVLKDSLLIKTVDVSTMRPPCMHHVMRHARHHVDNFPYHNATDASGAQMSLRCYLVTAPTRRPRTPAS